MYTTTFCWISSWVFHQGDDGSSGRPKRPVLSYFSKGILTGKIKICINPSCNILMTDIVPKLTLGGNNRVEYFHSLRKEGRKGKQLVSHKFIDDKSIKG